MQTQRSAMQRILIALFILICPSLLLGKDAFRLVVPDSQNQQLSVYSINPTASGVSLRPEDSLKLSFNPARLAVNPTNQSLVVSGTRSKKPVAAVVTTTKGMNVFDVSTLVHPVGYNSVDRSGRFFMTVHYGTGSVATYPLGKDGSIGDLAHSLTTPQREAHCILTTPDNRFVYIPCVKNNNALFQYAFDDASGKLVPLKTFNAEPPAMFGPRHVAYHPTLPIAYFSNEQQLGASVYEIGKEGQLSDLQHVNTIPRRSPFEQGKRDLHASDIALTPDGRLLFVALRDFNGEEDSVFSFSVDSNGKLRPAARTLVGDIPWKLTLSPDGKHLAICESGLRRITLFAVQSDGSLTRHPGVEIAARTNDMAALPLR